MAILARNIKEIIHHSQTLKSLKVLQEYSLEITIAPFYLLLCLIAHIIYKWPFKIRSTHERTTRISK